MVYRDLVDGEELVVKKELEMIGLIVVDIVMLDVIDDMVEEIDIGSINKFVFKSLVIDSFYVLEFFFED